MDELEAMARMGTARLRPLVTPIRRCRHCSVELEARPGRGRPMVWCEAHRGAIGRRPAGRVCDGCGVSLDGRRRQAAVCRERCRSRRRRATSGRRTQASVLPPIPPAPREHGQRPVEALRPVRSLVRAGARLDGDRDAEEVRMERLTKLYGWGEITDGDYRRRIGETRAALAELPDPDKLLAFDHNRHVMVTMAENVERATRPQLADLVRLLVERVTAKDQKIEPESITCTPPARPFFEPAALVWRPRTDSGAQYQRGTLDYYLEVG